MAKWQESAEKSLDNRGYKPKNTSSATTSSAVPSSPKATDAPKSTGTWQDQAEQSLVNRGYVPPENNTSEYTNPSVTDDSTKKDTWYSWLGKQALAGLGQFNKGLAATLDFVMPTEFLGKYDIFSNINNYYSQQNDYYSGQAQKSSESKGEGWKIAGDVVTGAVAALPNAVLAYMTAGASLGATGATTLATGATATAPTAGPTISALKQVFTTTMKNPSYWTSVMSTLGTDYEEAKKKGANDFVASTTAILTTALNAGIEVGSGIEQLPKNLIKNGAKSTSSAVMKWVKSSLEEGGEEVLQSITTNAIAKLMYDHDAPLYSTTDEKAVINPGKLAKEFGMGVAVGGLLGGGQTVVASGVNAKNISQTGKYYKNAGKDAVQSLVDAGLNSPQDSTAYKLAEQAQQKLNKKGDLSNYEVGKLFYANVEQIEYETKQNKNIDIPAVDSTPINVQPQDTKTTVPSNVVADTQSPTISVGDVFNDTKSGNTVTVLGRDAETTTVQVGEGEDAVIRQMPNSKADAFVTSGQLAKVGTSAETDVAKNATTTTETVSSETIKTINLTRVGNSYEVYGEAATMLANELGIETTKTVVNGVETDVLRLPADLAEGFADAVSDEYNLVLSDKPKAENRSATNETTTTDETTPSAEENTTESEISTVVNAMNDTFKPGAKEDLKNSDLKGDVVKLAELVSDFYKKNGTLSFFADYFTDEGATVISAIEGKTDTVANTSKTVVDVIGETLTLEAKANLQDGDVNANYNSIVKMFEEVYKESGTLEAFANFFVDGGKKVEATLQRNIDNAVGDKNSTTEKTESSEPKVLKNESESDTIESATENKSVEREDNSNESIRKSVLSRDGRRRHNESTRKQIGSISYFERKNKGRDATERQNFARELIERGQIEEVVDGKDKYNLVKPEAYNDDMLSMVEEAKKHGIELGFFVGSAKINFGTKDEFSARGIRIGRTKVVVQYDNTYRTPQQIAKHETIHAKWNTEAVKKIRDIILKSLSSQETNDIFAQKRYARYKEIYKNDNDVLQEFICDVMSGTSEYTIKHIDTVNDYWYGNEELDSYNVAEYSESIDAGGEDVTDGKYDLSDEGGEYDGQNNNGRGISGISEESGNKRRRNTSNKRDVPSGQTETLHQNKNSKPTETRNRDKKSGSKHLVRRLESLEASGKSSGDRQDTENRRFQQAIDNNDIATANDMFNKKAVANGYIPVKVYKGTLSDNVRTVFNKGNAIWVTPDYNYADAYSSEYSGTETEKSAQLHTEPNSNVYEFYAKYGNILELGNIEQEINTLEEIEAFAKKTGITKNEYFQCRLECKEEYGDDTPNAIWAITNTKRFAELARNNGYDSLHALERNGIETYGILHSENVKSAKLKTYDDKGKLIPLSKRFDNTTDDIRYDLDEDSDGNTLTEEQQEYFKDSKVRDENGNLLVVYHGTRNNNFTVFNRNHNYYTDSRVMAESYAPSGAVYKGYLNITKPYIIDASGEKWSKIPVSAEVKKMLDEAGSSTFKEQGKWRTSVADIVAAISDLVEDGDADYDGVIIRNVDDTGSYYKGSNKNIGTDYITFKSEQFKNADNTTPTSNPDIRYDLADADNEYLELAKNPEKNEAQLREMVAEAAEKAFSNSKARGSDGKLRKVYHGRVSDFNVFDRQFANIEGDFGKGYYFTSNEYDVDANYASEEGPDLKNKIARYAEQLEYNEEYSDLSYEEREEIARQKFITSEPNTITAYLNMENPVYITPDEKGTLLDYNESYDEEYDEYGEPEGLLVDFIEALNSIASDYSYRDVDFNFLYEYAYDNGGVYASDAAKIIKERIIDDLSDEEGNIATNEVIRLAFEEIGFDGIIDTSVYFKFHNMNGMDSGTTHYIVFDSEQIKSADPVTYDDKGNVISLSERFNKDNIDIRYDIDGRSNLDTQQKIEKMAKEITSHEEFISLTKQNTQEFVDKIKENKNLQKRLHNAKRQMLLSPNPTVNATKVGKVTKDILTEMESTLKAKDLQDRVTGIYNEYFAEMKKAKGVESKVQEANDSVMKKFADLAVDIADSSVAYIESEYYASLKSYLKEVRIKIPDYAKGEAHYNEFRKAHMGTFNLTNDGLEIDRVYQELLGMFPGAFSEDATSPADQLNEIADALERLKPYAYNPHSGYMQDAIDHIVYRFVSEADGIATMPKTKAQKIAEKGAYDKEMALDKERTEFERKLDRHKENSEKTIQALQKKIDDAKYVRYWEKRLSKEEKAQAVKDVRDKRDVAILKTKIRNIVSNMKQKLDKSEKAGGYPKELVQAAAEVCSVIDFQTGRTNKDGTPTKASLKLDALKMQYDALKNSPNYDFQSEYSEEISKKILNLHQKVENKRVVDLTKTELAELKDILSEISHGLSIASKQIGRENAKANYDIATEIINSLKLDNKAISEIRNQLLKEMRLAKESGKAFVVNPHRIFEMIANYDRGSAWWQLYDQILRGSRNVAKFTMDATMPFDELTDGGGNEIAFYDFRTKKVKTGIKYVDGTDVELPKSIICELVMLWDRKQGRSHLESGGIKIPDLKLFNKGKTADALAAGKMTNAITQSDIDRLKGMLDSYDKAWIERSRYLFNKVAKEAINETSMQLVGRELAKADNYIRIYVDSDFVKEDIGKNGSDITIEGHGSLKETIPEAKNPVVLRGLHENVYEHIDFAAKYYGLAIPIRNFNKVYKISINDNGNFDSVKNALGSVFGPKIRDGVVVQAIKDLQSPRHRELSVFNKVKGNWLNATFWANIRSTLKQTTSYWTASSILDEGSLVKGLASYNAHRKQTKAEIAKYSGTLYKRSQGLSTTELGDRANRKRLAGLSSKTTKFINEHLPVLRKIPEWIRPGNWLQSMDCAVSSALWDACKHQISKTMNASDDGYMKAVADLYERVIEETQSNYDVLHRPEALKKTGVGWETLSMFQTDNLQQTGIMYSAFGDLKAKHKAYKSDKSSVNEQNLKDAKKRMGKAIRARIYSSMWLAAVSILGDALLRKFKPYIDDEEKEITSSSVLEQMKLKMSEDMLSVFTPVVGQLATKAMETFGEGYDFLNDPAFDVLEDFIKATSKIYKAYDEDGDVLKAWTDAIPSLSNMTGVPAKNISELFNGVKGYIGDIKAGEFAHDLEDYTSGNKSFYNYGDLASYIASGDSEKETKWLDYYSANGKEIAKDSLTKEIKPAYVQMFLDSPRTAYNIKRKLVLDYDYTESAIDAWIYDEYLKHIVPDKKFADETVSNPEYAIEIRTFAQRYNSWDDDTAEKSIKRYYKEVYKEEAKKGEDKKESSALRKALLRDGVVTREDLADWEVEADKAIEDANKEAAEEKAKFKD